MIYKEYGNTGKKVSAVGFGGMRFDISAGQDKNADILQYAYDKGINFLDTAPGYCEDQSEDIFGNFVRRNNSRREDFYLSTKCMPASAPTKAEAIASVEKSLKRLNTDYIDFFYTWCIRKRGHYDDAIVAGGFYEGLAECKDRGLIKHITISSHLQGNELKSILDEGRFEGVLLGMNVLNFPFRWQAVQAAFDQGYGVAAMNPLAGGAIPQNEKILQFLAQEGETPTEAALRFCISCPQITVTLNGFTTTEHIDTACKAADSAKPFTDEQIQRIRDNVGKNMDALCTGCGYCLEGCGLPGDGFALTLFDPAASPAMGATGGSLGYANGGVGVNAVAGMAGGIAGIGFDAYGNFSRNDDGKIGGNSKETPRAVAIRGSEGQDYAYIDGTNSLSYFAKSYASSREGATVNSARVTITSDKKATVERKIDGSEWLTLIDAAQLDITSPENVMFGFTGSTGGASANNEIRNLTVTAVPEPTTIALLGFGLMGLVRKKKK